MTHVYGHLFGGPAHGKVLDLRETLLHLRIGEEAYTAIGTNDDHTVIVYRWDENGPATQAGPSEDGDDQ